MAVPPFHRFSPARTPNFIETKLFRHGGILPPEAKEILHPCKTVAPVRA
jgi:hypothetical protein